MSELSEPLVQSDPDAAAAAPSPPPLARRGRAWRPWGLGVLAASTLIGVVAWARHCPPVAAATAKAAPPLRTVRTAAPRRADAAVSITLAGTARPSEMITLMAKTTGYVRALRVDLGDRVAAGAPLMTLEAAEVGEELALARARLEEASQNAALAETTATRAVRLTESGVASQQEREDAQGLLNTARAAVATGKAEVERLRVLVGYQRITAPFAGTVIRRLVDPGALAQSGQTALLELAATDQLDIEVEIPQTLAAHIAPGLAVAVRGRDLAGPPIQGTITRTAGALSASTRTLRVEIRIRGDAGILPNSYVSATLTSHRAAPPLVVPANAVAATGDGTIVGVVRGGVALMHPVRVLRDLGKELEIEEVAAAAPDVAPPSGAASATAAAAPAAPPLDEHTQIILNVPADLRHGEAVRIGAPQSAT